MKDSLEVLPTVDPLIQFADLQHHLLRCYVVVPEARCLCLGLEPCNNGFFPIDVKDNLVGKLTASAAP